MYTRINQTIQDKLMKIISLCYEISNKTDADVFFNYSPHVNYITVYYYENGYHDDENFIKIGVLEEITFELLIEIEIKLIVLYERKTGEYYDRNR